MEIKQETLKTLRSNTLQGVNQGKKRIHSFNVDFSDVDPKFTGTFVVHHPSQMERLQIGVIKSSLLGGNLEVDLLTDNIATIISTLEVVLEERPDWFDPFSDDLDYEVMEAVYLEYTQWMNTFRKQRSRSGHEGDSKDNGSKVSMDGTEDVPSTTN